MIAINVPCSVQLNCAEMHIENIGPTLSPFSPSYMYDMSILERDGHEAVAAQTDQCFAFQYKQYYWNKAGGTRRCSWMKPGARVKGDPGMKLGQEEDKRGGRALSGEGEDEDESEGWE